MFDRYNYKCYTNSSSLTSFKKQRCLHVVNKVDYKVNKNR